MAGAPMGGQQAQPGLRSTSMMGPDGTMQVNYGMAPQPNINQIAMGNIAGASQATQREMGYQPGMIRSVGTAPQITAGQLSTTDMSQYMNPYTQNVIDTVQADLERQRQMQQNVGGAQASAAGAFGGSRHGVAEALTNEAFARQGAQTAAGLRQAGFDVARQMAGQDIAGRYAADVQNQAARIGDINRLMQAQQFNIGTGLQGSQQRLGAAGQLAGIGGQAFGMGQNVLGNLQNVGMQQTAMNQALIDAYKQQYGGYQQYPGMALGFMGQALGATPTPQTTTATRQPGLFDYLTLGTMAKAYGAI